LVVLFCVAAVGAACIRLAVVAWAADRNTALAARFWSHHPDVLHAETMLGVSRAASQGTPISENTAHELDLLSNIAPLSSTPFAIAAAVALRANRYGDAEPLLVEARRRDPRDRGVRFLLADLYLRESKVREGLEELVTLATLSPTIASAVTDMLANYARTGGAVPPLREALRPNPDLKRALLLKLAQDGGNAGLVLSLAAPVRPSGDLADWEKTLLSSLVKAGDPKKALVLLRQFSNRTQSDLGDFSEADAGSPFAWTLLTSSDGVATGTRDRLDLQFFGRSDAVLASRVLVLAPGHYELRFRVESGEGEPSSVHWIMTCLQQDNKLLEVTLPNSSPSPSSAPFEVPADCPAQSIALKGLAAVDPAELTFSIAGLEVRKRS
jgi:hypothetical protein